MSTAPETCPFCKAELNLCGSSKLSGRVVVRSPECRLICMENRIRLIEKWMKSHGYDVEDIERSFDHKTGREK